MAYKLLIAQDDERHNAPEEVKKPIRYRDIDHRRAVMHSRHTIRERCALEVAMKILILFVAWLILLALSWPLAILALAVAPLVWLIALPFRLLGAVSAPRSR